MSSDTWTEIQEHKNKQSSLREKLARRKKERQEQIGSLGAGSPVPAVVQQLQATTSQSGSDTVASKASPSQSIQTGPSHASVIVTPTTLGASPVSDHGTKAATNQGTTSSSPIASSSDDPKASKPPVHLPPEVLSEVEKHLLLMLSDITLILPMEVSTFKSNVSRQMNQEIPQSAVEDLMQKFSAQMLVNLENEIAEKTGKYTFVVESVDHNKLSAVTNEMEGLQELDQDSRKRKKYSEEEDIEKTSKQAKKSDVLDEDLIESLLSTESAKQRESKKMTDEILQLLSKPTAKEQSLIEKFKSQGGAQVKEFCPNGTKEECMRDNEGQACDKLHFRKIIHKHTDESLGDCSFLNTCFHMDTCKYVHYEIDYPENIPRSNKLDSPASLKKSAQEGSTILFPPQWIQCDLRSFDMMVLGKFAVVMADPPWDIHMELPYGTMSDDEMRKLQVPVLQDEGYIFLWVTGRAMELGRECLQLWGYERVDELIWVKTNQLQRIIRTGRTGHWLNHGKEHCLIGAKGNPKSMNRGLDCDVIVAEVRATSHKPDEIYGIIERLSPGTRKIELFGRPHNVQPNWFTLGNQVDGVKLNEPDVVKAFKSRYPDGNCMKPK